MAPLTSATLSFAASGIACGAILTILLRSGFAVRYALDLPNHRSLHTAPTPRCGGWGVLPVVIVASIIAGPPYAVALSLCLLGVINLVDDRFGAPARLRLLVQVVAAALPLLFDVSVSYTVAVGCLILIVWGSNLFNFMDGSNGMAGGMMVAGFGSYAAASFNANSFLSTTSAALAGAGAAFLCFNWGKARLFLGDTGSVPAGFAMATLGILGWYQGIWPTWFPPLVFAPFIFDATVTLLRRAMRRERIWIAHREHFYQRLILMGLSHQRTALIFIGMMLFSEGLGFFLIKRSSASVDGGLLVEMIMLLSVGGMIEWRWRRFLTAGSKNP